MNQIANNQALHHQEGIIVCSPNLDNNREAVCDNLNAQNYDKSSLEALQQQSSIQKQLKHQEESVKEILPNNNKVKQGDNVPIFENQNTNEQNNNQIDQKLLPQRQQLKQQKISIIKQKNARSKSKIKIVNYGSTIKEKDGKREQRIQIKIGNVKLKLKEKIKEDVAETASHNKPKKNPESQSEKEQIQKNRVDEGKTDEQRIQLILNQIKPYILEIQKITRNQKKEHKKRQKKQPNDKRNEHKQKCRIKIKEQQQQQMIEIKEAKVQAKQEVHVEVAKAMQAKQEVHVEVAKAMQAKQEVHVEVLKQLSHVQANYQSNNFLTNQPQMHLFHYSSSIPLQIRLNCLNTNSLEQSKHIIQSSHSNLNLSCPPYISSLQFKPSHQIVRDLQHNISDISSNVYNISIGQILYPNFYSQAECLLLQISKLKKKLSQLQTRQIKRQSSANRSFKAISSSQQRQAKYHTSNKPQLSKQVLNNERVDRTSLAFANSADINQQIHFPSTHYIVPQFTQVSRNGKSFRLKHRKRQNSIQSNVGIAQAHQSKLHLSLIPRPSRRKLTFNQNFRQYSDQFFTWYQSQLPNPDWSQADLIKKSKMAFWKVGIDVNAQNQLQLSIKRYKNCVSFILDSTRTIIWHFEGKFYYGGWSQGEKNGWGFDYHPGKYVYSGNFISNKRNSYGIIKYLSDENDAIYEGQWKDNLKHGFGKQVETFGEEYMGEWTQGGRSGRGWIKTDQSTIYEIQTVDAVQTDYDKPYLKNNRRKLSQTQEQKQRFNRSQYQHKIKTKRQQQ